MQPRLYLVFAILQPFLPAGVLADEVAQDAHVVGRETVNGAAVRASFGMHEAQKGLVLPITVDGMDYPFLVDTGFSRTLFDYDLNLNLGKVISLTSKTVIVQRRIPVHLDTKTIQNYFQFGSKRDAQGNPTDFYRAIIDDRLVFLGTSAGGTSENASLIQTSISHLQDPAAQDLLFMLSQNILNFIESIRSKLPDCQKIFCPILFPQIEVPTKGNLLSNGSERLERSQRPSPLRKDCSVSRKRRTCRQAKGKYLKK